ncbi:hypothetical protein V6N13_119047 [Hibiscus sabdariffa]|uniref:Uncharacterized protein n=1 Tax=Hibiscus sabdariffa TaxID=183260 RepID=A0ABR2E036_9ROSI
MTRDFQSAIEENKKDPTITCKNIEFNNVRDSEKPTVDEGVRTTSLAHVEMNKAKQKHHAPETQQTEEEKRIPKIQNPAATIFSGTFDHEETLVNRSLMKRNLQKVSWRMAVFPGKRPEFQTEEDP